MCWKSVYQAQERQQSEQKLGKGDNNNDNTVSSRDNEDGGSY